VDSFRRNLLNEEPLGRKSSDLHESFLADTVHIYVWTNHIPWGFLGATIGKTIYCVYIGNNLYNLTQSHPANFNGTNHSWVTGIQVRSKVTSPPQRGDKKYKNRVESSKNLLKNHYTRKVQTYIESSSRSVRSFHKKS
jgi:hypothetical protein